MTYSFKLKWREKEIIVGKSKNVLVNQLIGMNNIEEYLDNIEKIDMWDDDGNRPDIITDLSLCDFENKISLWKYALSKGKYIVGMVPIYKMKDKKNIDKSQLLHEIDLYLKEGVKIITIHPTATKKLLLLSKNRITPITSRGGAIVAKDMIENNKDINIYLECLNEIIKLCIKYKVAISIGTTFRAANIIDSMDEVQIEEIKIQMKLANYIKNKGVDVVIEQPGHASPKKIQYLNKLIADNEFPIMPLGPVVTDVGAGLDHITAAIGLTIMGLENNVQIISAMTAEEHTGKVPTIKSTKEAVETARLVAHLINMENSNDYSIDREIALGRRKSCVYDSKKDGCSRCGLQCPLIYEL